MLFLFSGFSQGLKLKLKAKEVSYGQGRTLSGHAWTKLLLALTQRKLST